MDHVRRVLGYVILSFLALTPPFTNRAHAACGGPPPGITSVTVSAISDNAGFTVSVGYNEYTEDLFWNWAGGPTSRAELYLGGRSNPYVIGLNAACLIGTQQLQITASNCL